MAIRIVRLGTPRAAHFAVGCYCENYHRCHRSILEQLLREHGARVVANPS